MGCLFRPKYKDRAGQTQTSTRWSIQYRDGAGKLMREATGFADRKQAERRLRLREGAAAEGRRTDPKADRVMVAELFDDLTNDYTVNGRHVDRLRFSLAHLTPVFGHRRAAQVTTSDVTKYTASRLAKGAANGTVNRELAALKRAFSLATTATPPKLHSRPYIRLLKEDNVRQGFLEPAQIEDVVGHLPEDLRPLVRVAYITGWRVASELVPLEWRQVDFQAGQLRLEPGMGKSKQPRLFPFTPELRAILEAQRAATDQLQRRRGMVVRHVFHRAGKPIRDFRGAWQNACRAAGVPGKVPHDMRRSSVRNTVRAGVPEVVAMRLSGHKTRAIFDRYNVVSGADLVDAADKLAAFAAQGSARPSARRPVASAPALGSM